MKRNFEAYEISFFHLLPDSFIIQPAVWRLLIKTLRVAIITKSTTAHFELINNSGHEFKNFSANFLEDSRFSSLFTNYWFNEIGVALYWLIVKLLITAK